MDGDEIEQGHRSSLVIDGIELGRLPQQRESKHDVVEVASDLSTNILHSDNDEQGQEEGCAP